MVDVALPLPRKPLGSYHPQSPVIIHQRKPHSKPTAQFFRAFLHTHHGSGRGVGVGFKTGGGGEGAGGDALDGFAGAGIEQMTVAAAINDHKIFVLPRGAHCTLSQFHGRALAFFFGVFEPNGPVVFAGRQADHAQVATGFYHRIANAGALQRGNGAVHGVAFAEAAGVDGHILRGSDQLISFYFNMPIINFGEHASQLGIGRHSVAFFFDEPPQIGERTDGGIKRAVGFLRDGEGALEDGDEIGVHFAAVIRAGEGAVITVDTEEFIDDAKFIEGSRNGRLHLRGLTVNGDGNEGAEVRLDACDCLSGRPALAAGEQTPKQGAAPIAKYCRCGERLR